MFTALVDYLLFAACLFILAGSLYLTVKLRFVQLRVLPTLWRMLKESVFSRKQDRHQSTISPHKALFTAMSTTLGISTIVAPVISISLGGPGALLGFLLTSILGSAATFTEVSLSVQHRRRLDNGTIMGGPMQYLKHILSPRAAAWYAISCLLLMTAWSGTQANQLVAILDSPLLGDYRVPTYLSATFIAGTALFILVGGIKRLSSFSAKLVPIMFTIYIGSSLWILFANSDKLGAILSDIFVSAFYPYALASGAFVGGIVSALRWGIFKGLQANEAGIGTQSIPHSLADTHDPEAQGALAMLSTYTAGFVAFLSGCVALITETWQDPELPLGISMVAASYQLYFSSFGFLIVALCTLLFAFGTIIGNSYNGSQCFGYLTENKGIKYYFLASSFIIFLGGIAEVKMIWSFVDLILVCVAVPHMVALLVYVYRSSVLNAEPQKI